IRLLCLRARNQMYRSRPQRADRCNSSWRDPAGQSSRTGKRRRSTMFMPSNQQTAPAKPLHRPHNEWTFRNRESAGLMLAERLKARSLDRPLVLAIPRGGVVLGAVLARELGAELDVVLARKLRAPGNPECAVGAISETGQVYLHPASDDDLLEHEGYLAKEREHQLSEMNWRKEIYRSV